MTSIMPGVEGEAVNAPLGFVGSGSVSPAFNRHPEFVLLPGLAAGARAESEKSPVRCRGGRTWALRTVPRISRFHSSETKKQILSCCSGTPAEPPKSFRRTLFFGELGLNALRIVSCESRTSLRPK